MVLIEIKKFLNLYNPLAQKVVKGTLWLFFLRITVQIFRIVKVVILAKLLNPNDFGIFAIAMMAVGLLESFSQTGFNQALIQKKGNINQYLNTAWIIQILRGFFLAFLLFLSAPFIAVFFKSPATENIIKFISLVLFIQGFTNIAIVYFIKEIEFHKYAFYQILGTFVDLVVSIVFGFLVRNVWALVWGYFGGVIIRVLFSYIFFSFRPKLRFSLVGIKELMNFGKWIFCSNIISFFIFQGVSIFIGKLLGTISLGFYQIAYKISSILNVEIISGALFPAFARLQDKKEKLKQAYLKTIHILFLLLFPLGGGLLVLSYDFVKIFLGEKWLSSVSPLQILAGTNLIWAMVVINGFLYQAIGKPKIETLCNGIRLIILLILVYPFTIKWGVIGASLSVFLSVFSAALVSGIIAGKLIGFNIQDFIKMITIPLLNTLLMILVINFVKKLISINFLTFSVLILGGGGVYFGLFYLFYKLLNHKIDLSLKEKINFFFL